MTRISLNRYMGAGLLGLHFTPEELFIGVGRRNGRLVDVGCLDCIGIRDFHLEGGELNQGMLAPLIKQTLRDKKIHTRKTVVSFPVKFPWIREIEVPRANPREMDQIVRLEVERLYLDSTVEKLIDYCEIVRGEDAPGDNARVLSCAIPRNTAAPYIELISAAGLELVGLDLPEVNVLKLAALQGIDSSEGIVIILNFNMASTDLLLMENNSLQLVRKISQGKEQLRNMLKDRLPDDSGIKHELPMLNFTLPTRFIGLAADFVSGMVGELRRSVEFYLADIKRAQGSVTKIILAGSGYWPANLAEVLAQQLSLPLVDFHFDKLPNVTAQLPAEQNLPMLGVYAPVVGSVLRGWRDAVPEC